MPAHFTYTLLSVGSKIDTRGYTYPMFDDGRYDGAAGVYILDIETDDDWFNGLDSADRTLVNRIISGLRRGHLSELATMWLG
jgi:hypothetical protein